MQAKQRRTRLWATIMATVIVLSACAKAPAARVGVHSVALDIAFGIPQVEEPAAPDYGSSNAPVDYIANDNNLIKKDKPLPRIHSESAKEKCPDADSKSVRVPAGQTFQNGPPPGNYRWKVNGFQKLGTSGFIQRLPLFEENPGRTIGAASKTPPDSQTQEPKGDYFYSTVQVLTNKEVLTKVWHVVTSHIVQADPGGLPQRQDPNAEGVYVNGLFLHSLSRVDQLGNAHTFKPQPEVLYLPVPATQVRFGFNQSYVDPDTFETWQLRGIVQGGTQEFDACGEEIDSIFVNASLTTIFNNKTTSWDYNYGVATQYGGVLVAEDFTEPCAFHAPDNTKTDDDGVAPHCDFPKEGEKDAPGSLWQYHSENNIGLIPNIVKAPDA